MFDSEVRRAALAAVRRRGRELSVPDALDRFRATRLAAVVRWRCFDRGRALHRLEPFFAERAGANPGRWLEDGDVGDRTIQCGFDTDARVVVARGPLGGGEDEHFVCYRPELAEFVAMRWEEDGRYRARVTHVFLAGGRRVVATASDDGTWGEYIYHKEAPGPRALIEFDERGEQLTTTSFEYDDLGMLARVRFASSLDEGVVWDRRTDAPEEATRSFRETAAGLAPELAAATAQGIRDAARRMESPVFVVSGIGHRSLLPEGVVVDRAFVDRMRDDEEGRDAAVLGSFAALGEARGVVEVDVVSHLSADALQRARQFRQRDERRPKRAGDAAERTATAVATSVEVIRLLNGPDGLSPLPVVALVADDMWSVVMAACRELVIPPLAPPDRAWAITAATAGMDFVRSMWELLGAPTDKPGQLPDHRLRTDT